LPGAFLAAVIAFLIFAALSSFLPFARWFIQLWCGWIVGVIFVMIGAAIAPSKRFTVAVALAAINLIGMSIFTIAEINAPTYHPTWWLVVCNLSEIAGTVLPCFQFHEEECNWRYVARKGIKPHANSN